ncbi:hypothetical protein [Puia dinghuensis]|uniref:hypothetical protein n=1 Tax=Puia dinghuensis TaxID=1792502 RepID=UPI00166CF493|nr:hypothetical protein [Puia dinghuensis]
MKKTTLLAILLLGRLLTEGQQKVFELPMDSADAQGLHVVGTPDGRSGNILLSITSPHSIRYCWLSGDSAAGAPVILTTLDYNSKKSRYLVTAAFPDGIETCISNKDYSLLRFLHSELVARQTRQTDSLAIPSDQQLFQAFYQDNTFYAITVQKHANTLFIYRRRPGAGTDTFQKEIPIKKWGIIWWHGTRAFIKNHVDNCYDLAGSVGMTQEDSITPPPMSAVVNKSKCYIRPGMLYLTFDTHQLVTNVIEVPLDERPSRLLQFNPEDWYHKALPIGFSTGNSFIFDNTLITTAIVHRQPWLAFYDLHTGKLITSYAPDTKGNTSFPRSPIWQEGDFWRKDKIHPIKLEDFAVNAFDFWTMGVSARKLDSGRIEVSIGTIYNRESFGQLMLILSAATIVVTEPVLLFEAAPIHTMYFYSCFENDTFGALPYKEMTDKSELINTFANSQNIPRKQMSGFQHGNDYWLAWYDAGQQKYLIYKF